MSQVSKDSQDPGVIGMSYFTNQTNPQSPRSLVASSYQSGDQGKRKTLSAASKKTESEVFEYASNGEWGKLSEEDRQMLVSEMKSLRAKTEEKANRAGKGKKYLYIGAVVVALIMIGKRRGIIPSSMFPSLSTTALATFAWLISAIYQLRSPQMANPKHPKIPDYVPFFGMTLDILPKARKGMAAFSLEMARLTNFSTTETVMVGGNRAVSIMDPIDRKYILKDNWKNFLKNSSDPSITSFTDIFAEILGRGIFSTDKREWQDHRKIASSMFSVSGLRQQMEDVFKEHSNKLVKMLGEVADKGGMIDIQNMFQSFTFDTICEIAFGVSPNSLDYAMRGEREPFLVAFDFAQVATTTRAFEPQFMWEFKRYFGIGVEGELPEHMRYINNYVNNIITQRKQSQNVVSKNDLLSLYIQFARKTGQSYMEEDAYLKDIILNFMIAGRDTTACTLTNWFKLVGVSNRGDEIAKIIVDECDQVLKSKQADELTWESANDLTYSDAVFNESIRMYPPVGGDFRITESDDVLPSSGFKLPAGTKVIINNYPIGRDPHLWKEPDTFNPERWVTYADDGKTMMPIKRPDEYVFPVFWAGPRLCLGKDMARFEAKLVACAIFKSFRLEIQPHEDQFVNGPVIFYTNPVNAIVKRIN